MAFIETLIVIFLILVIVAIFARGVVIIQPYEQGLQIRLGQYVGRMNPRVPLDRSVCKRSDQTRPAHYGN